MKLSLSIILICLNAIAYSQETNLLVTDFGSNGYYVESQLKNAKVIGIDSKERIYLIGRKNESDLNTFYLKRIDEKGNLDKEYGDNGFVELKTMFESHHPTGLVLKNNKVLISCPYSLGWTDQPKNYTHGSYYHVFKITEEGQFDLSFADKGTVCKAPGRLLNGSTENKLLFTNSDSIIITNNNLEVEQGFFEGNNNKLNFRVFNYSIVANSDKKENFYIGAERRNYNCDTDTIQITKINSDLRKDISFGNNGELYQFYKDRKSILGNIDVIDSSLYISTSVYDLAEPVIYKYHLNGTPNISFGKKGMLQLKKAIDIKDTTLLRGGIRGLEKSSVDESLHALSIYNIFGSKEYSFNKYFITSLTLDGKVIENKYLGSLKNQPILDFFLINKSLLLPEYFRSNMVIIYKIRENNYKGDKLLHKSRFDIFFNQNIDISTYIEPNRNQIKKYYIKNLLGKHIFESSKRQELIKFITTLNGIYMLSAETTDYSIINDLLILK